MSTNLDIGTYPIGWGANYVIWKRETSKGTVSIKVSDLTPPSEVKRILDEEVKKEEL